VTAAATTAVLVIGAGPGVTALATTAVFATGARMTPTLPTRAGRTGISVFYCRSLFVSLDRAMMAWLGIRSSAISWPPARRAADANGAAHRFSHMSTPAVLPASLRRTAGRNVEPPEAARSLSSGRSSSTIDAGRPHPVGSGKV
jgi:hypothetical protein